MNSAAAPAILDHLSVLRRRTRSRMLLLLERHELTVAELCARAAAAAVDRQPAPEGARRRRLGGGARRRHEPPLHAWRRDELDAGGAPALAAACASRSRESPAAAQDATAPRRRARGAAHEIAGVLRLVGGAVGSRCATSCSATASTCTRCSALARRAWVVGDLGCGTGQVSAALAPFVGAGDRGRRLGGDAAGGAPASARRSTTSTLRRGELEALPIDDGELDAATLHAGAAPRAGSGARARRGGARRSAGRAAASSSTCCRTTARSTGSRWATSGSASPSADRARYLADAGFEHGRDSHARRPTPKAQGPALFVATRVAAPVRQRRPMDMRRQVTRRGEHDRSAAAKNEDVRRETAKAAAAPFKVKDLVARRVRPQGDPPRRAGDARPDGAARALRAASKPLAGAQHHGQPAHDDADRGADRDAGRARRRRALGVVQHLLDAGPRRRGGRRRPPETGGTVANPKGTPVFAWKGETLEEYWWCTERGARCGPTAAARR